MMESQTIKNYRNKLNKLNKIYSLIPKRLLNTENNIYTYRDNKIHSYRDFKSKRIKIRNINNKIESENNNSISHFNKNNIYQNYLFKTLNKEKKLSLSCRKYKKFLYSENNKNNSSKYNNKSEKISLTILNDYFIPEESDRSLNNKKEFIFKPKIRKNNYSTQVNKTNSVNNNLCYYFPNLFNVPYNKIVSPDKNLNTSKFFFKNLKDLNYNENIKNLSLIKKNKINNKDASSSEKKLNSESPEPIFIEKVYSFDILKNLRFNFKNLVEKGKHKNFINSFYITRNLKFNNQ